MNSRRSLWLDDLNAGVFKLEKIGSSDQEDEDNDQMQTDEVTNTQDVTFDDESSEKEEWGGLGDLLDE
jgi:hypothetical protein